MIKYFGESLIIIDHQEKIKYGSFYLMMVFHILRKGESEGGSLVMHDRGRKGKKKQIHLLFVLNEEQHHHLFSTNDAAATFSSERNGPKIDYEFLPEHLFFVLLGMGITDHWIGERRWTHPAG